MDKRILLLDDDVVTRRRIARVLSDDGYAVLEAASGKDGLEIILSEAPRLLITNMQLPGTDGLHVCRALRAHEGIGYTFIIMLTASADERQVVEAFDAGADDYIVKPVRPEELLGRVRAGERIVRLESDLAHRNEEILRYSTSMAIANQKLLRVATTDELTCLINRREGLALLKQCWEEANEKSTPLACVACDLDHFKRVNDTFGHDVGDRVLKAAANAMTRVVRRTERVCRIGGEEFLIICPRSTASQAGKLAERLRQAIAHLSLDAEGLNLSITVSLGVAEKTPETPDFDVMLKAADEALYRAKHNGRNRVEIAGHTTRLHVATPAPLPILAARPPWVGDAAVMKVLAVGRLTGVPCDFRDSTREQPVVVADAANDDSAIAHVHADTPNVIVIDAGAPAFEGPATIRRFRSDPVAVDLPIIVIGDAEQREQLIDCLESGADEYLTRPINARELTLRMKSLLRISRLISDVNDNSYIRGEQARVLTLLLEYSQRIALTDNLNHILTETAIVAAELTCARDVSILLHDVDDDCLGIAYATGLDKKMYDDLRLPMKSLCGQVFVSGNPLIINDDWRNHERPHAIDRLLLNQPPFLSVPLTTVEQKIGILNIAGRHANRPFADSDIECIDLFSSFAAAAIDECMTRHARDQARDSIVFALATLAEYRDDDTGTHLHRVTRGALLLAEELQRYDEYADVIDEQFMADLKRAVPLHDIGKVAIPDQILLKPGRLTDSEIEVMRTHTTTGARTIQSVLERIPGVSFLEFAEEIAHFHHEWYDGSGYPTGLRGHDIPLSARIVALADVYDALTTERVYKKAMSHETASRIIHEECGTHFDPLVIKAFIARADDFKAELTKDTLAAVAAQNSGPRDRSAPSRIGLDRAPSEAAEPERPAPALIGPPAP